MFCLFLTVSLNFLKICLNVLRFAYFMNLSAFASHKCDLSWFMNLILSLSFKILLSRMILSVSVFFMRLVLICRKKFKQHLFLMNLSNILKALLNRLFFIKRLNVKLLIVFMSLLFASVRYIVCWWFCFNLLSAINLINFSAE